MNAGRRRVGRIALAIVALLVGIALVLVRRDVPRADLTAKYAPPPSQFAEIEGMRVHFRDEGPRGGTPLVLLHGTSSSLHTWDGWVARLSPQRRIVRLDMPGFGLTGRAPDADYGAARLAHVVVALLDRLGIDKADVAGNSLGGRVAATIALDHRSRVRRLVLVDTSGLSGQRLPSIYGLARTPIVRELLTVITPRSLVRKNLREVYGEPSRVEESLVDRYEAFTLVEGNRRALVDRLNGPRDPDLDARLGELHLPVLLLWGERDRWIPTTFAERWKQGVAGATLVTYPTLGHVPMEEDPEATSRDAERFLAAD